LSFRAVLLLLLTALFVTLLLLGLTLGLALLLLNLLIVPASLRLIIPTRRALLLPLLTVGLVLLPPLFPAAASALGIREITCAHQRGGNRKRQPNLF